MTENENRRSAKRQQRGLRRQAEILEAAAQVFAENGYSGTTTNAIAARAQVSPGSLYQFFPNKETIALALARRYTDELHSQWDSTFSSETLALPLNTLVDHLIDAQIMFNIERPGFSVLFFAEDAAPQIVTLGAELHDGMIARFVALIEARNPAILPEQREVIANVMMKIYKAFVPGMIGASDVYNRRMIREMKAVLRGYLEPYIGD